MIINHYHAYPAIPLAPSHTSVPSISPSPLPHIYIYVYTSSANAFFTSPSTVLTLSEVCAAKLLEEITEEVEQYEGVCHQLAYDRIVQLWDSRTYEYDEERGPPVVSAQGKYMGVPLRHMDLGQSHLHVSVHLPLKRNRNAACQLLQEYLEDNQEHYNYIHIHGDFNSDRHVLQDRFAALHPTFAFDAVTTRAGRKRDNVVSLWDKTIFGIGRRSYFRKSINKIMKLSSAKFPSIQYVLLNWQHAL